MSTCAKFCRVNVTRMQEKLCGAGNTLIFWIVEYFFILHFQKISGAESVSEEKYFGTQNIFLFYDVRKKKEKIPKNSEKLFGWHSSPLFRKRRRLVPIVNIGNFFYNKLDAKYSQIGKNVLAKFCKF